MTQIKLDELTATDFGGIIVKKAVKEGIDCYTVIVMGQQEDIKHVRVFMSEEKALFAANLYIGYGRFNLMQV